MHNKYRIFPSKISNRNLFHKDKRQKLSQEVPQNKISHFVLSRFNIHLKEYLQEYNMSKKITEKQWMDRHLDVFEKTTLESLKNQICQDFIYLCFFDYRTSSEHRKRISNINNLFHNFIPIYVSVSDASPPNIFDNNLKNMCKKYVRELCSDKTELIVQTRIDIDDYIHKDFISTVQNYAKKCSKKGKKIVVFPIGYNIDIRDGKKELWKREFINNQFPTLIEEYNDKIIGIWARGHREIGKCGEVVQLCKDRPMWLWVSHGKNLTYLLGYKWVTHGDFISCEFNFEKLKEEFSYDDYNSRILV